MNSTRAKGQSCLLSQPPTAVCVVNFNLDIEKRANVLRERITRAFAGVPLPDRKEMVTSGDLDELWCAKELGGRLRDEITVTDVLPECLMWMPLPAVHYYFPMFLLHLLKPENRDSAFILQSMIGYLDRRSNRMYPQFSSAQQHCILEWLDFIRDNMDAYEFWGFKDRYERRLQVIRDQWVDGDPSHAKRS